MRHLAALGALALLAGAGACSSTPSAAAAPVDAVDPLIGSGGAGFRVGSANPGPSVPWGMVKPGPDTSSGIGSPVFYHDAGYYYPDTLLLGFSHTHLHGVGAADYGNVLVLPTLGMTAGKTTPPGYQSAFSHATETAEAGYYALTLADSQIRCELTATRYTGVHRYTFPAGAADPVILIDAAHVLYGELTAGHVDVDPAAAEVTGAIVSQSDFSGRYGGIPMYFVARFTTPFTSHGLWNDGVLADGATAQDGLTLGAYVGFAAGGTVEAQVALSFVSLEQARANLAAEATTFDDARAAARAAWSEALGLIDIETPSAADRTIFYTALYHLMQMPTQMTEAGGVYMGFDRQPHQADGFVYHSDFSLWDTYRTFHPFVTLVLPEKARDFVLSLVRMYEQGGAFPKWPMGIGEGGSMVGTPADIVVADSWLKGITRDIDIEAAYVGLRAHATGPLPAGQSYGDRPGIEDYIALGYLPADRHGGSVSVTQEYAYADFALAQLATALGKTEDAALFAGRALSHRNLWNPETRFFEGRLADGSWVTNFDPVTWQEPYVEGDAWQYRFFPPSDVAGLIELFGGAEAFMTELEAFFVKGKAQPISPALPNPYYWHSNEPDLHAAYLFTLAGRPAKTQEWVRWALAESYTTAPDGLPGNDDAGTMSAWYLFSAMGFYPLPATDVYVIGSPILTRAVLHLPGGDFEVRAPAASPQNLYVQTARLNGAALATPFLRHAQLTAGGVLELDMGPAPSTWGAGATAP
ncbi:MAG TPA: GH92 family glycosyl hydrolase [Polyangia bacterium]|jgi:predicted alpha-1,2-mannosidase